MANMRIAERRELLLDAGVRVIARSGLASATTRAVVTEAGMPLASFHYAFESHEDFLRRLVERELVPHQVPIPAADSFPEALRAFLRLLVDDDAADNGVAAELALYGVLRDGLRGELADRMQDYDSHLADTLRELARANGMEWSMDPERLAPQVNAWRFGSVVHAAYRRHGTAYAPHDGVEEFSEMLAYAARPATGPTEGNADGPATLREGPAPE